MQELEAAKLDYLTKCYVKEAVAPVLDKLVIEDKAFDRKFSVLLLDVDHFKSLNDTYGHLHGDAVLKFFSSSLRLGLEESGAHIFRFGGDEFVVIFPQKDPQEVAKIAAFMRYALRKRPLLIGGRLFNISFSGGIASSRDGKTPEDILACADKAMYVSKKYGRARSTVYGRIGWARMVHTFSRLGTLLGLCVIFAVLAVTAVRIYFPDASKTGIAYIKGYVPGSKEEGNTVTVKLRSGRSFKGVIVKEQPESIDLQLAMETGSARVSIKRSDIVEIIANHK